MKGMWRILFIGCFYAFATFNVANAVDCSTFTTRETCETDANYGCIYSSTSGCNDCGNKSYRYKKDDGTYDCKQCTNGPTIDDKACGADGADCQYTGNNGDSPNCPWTLTCADNTYWKSDGQKCVACDEHYTAPEVVVRFDGTNYTYTVNGTDKTTAPQCEGEVYSIEFKRGNIGNGHTITNTPDPDFLYEKYGDGFYTDAAANLLFDPADDHIEPLHGTRKFLGYFTNEVPPSDQESQSDASKMVFDHNGKMDSGITNTKFTNHATLYAHWGPAGVYTLTLQISNGTNPYIIARNSNCVQGQPCDTDIKNIPCSGGFYLQKKTITTDYGNVTRTDNAIIYTPNAVALTRIIIDKEITINISDLVETCPIGSYCPKCDRKQCPYGSTTDNIGKTSRSSCYWNASTQFTDSTGGTFTLPVSSNAQMKVQIPTD